MQRTEKYYEADAFRREATGRILAVEPGKTGGKLALDGTVFYPEGGGQPADRGTLTLADGTTLAFTGVKSMTATAYTAGHGGADYTTATGTLVRVGTVAVDKSVIPLGTRMYIVSNDGSVVYGLAVAEDTGVRGNIVDLYYNTYEECINFGRRGCTVYILE